MTASFNWPDDWASIDANKRQGFETELKRELCPDHILHGKTVIAVARRGQHDDFLFVLDDGRLAQVHLTWTRETEPEWPWTEIFATLEAWRVTAQ